MKKIMVLFGTRPEAIKMCPVVKELEKHKDKIETVVCVTGQHREMLQQVLDVFEVVPEYNLDIMKSGQTLFSITSDILLKIEEVLDIEKPDLIMVHGDTSTTFVSALAGFYKKIPVAHVEAGLRTNDLYSPYPEEFNRQAVGLLARYHFAPTETSKENLIKEGKKAETIFITGNTAIDALKTTVREGYNNEHLEWAGDSRMVLLTAHRRENIGDSMVNMFSAINQVVDENEDIKVVFPIHMNPQVRELANSYLKNDRITIIEPMDVIDFHNMLARAYLVMTDSGGIQEEAPSLGKPVLVMRDTTERPEGVAAGTLKLVGTTRKTIYEAFSQLLNDKEVYSQMSEAKNPYGDGFASKRIVETILKDFS